MSRLFLGLDSSTQSLSAIVIDADSRKVVYEGGVNFDEALPQYGTSNGALRADDPLEVHSPPLMWVEAMDLLLQRMVDDGVAMGEILCVSGSGQQHGSVYLKESVGTALAHLDPEKSLVDNLSGCFSRQTAPIWMDSSTRQECEEIEEALGGLVATAEATGSAAFERFSGPQIRKFAKNDPAAYADTGTIALVSSFLASVLAGRIAPIDHGDGAGMNLMDIQSFTWHDAALAATAPDLGKKLPPVSSSWSLIGPISPYFKKYGFSPSTHCAVWSGDNPNSVVGLGLVEPGQVAISLGTSDTFFGTMSDCQTDPNGEGHVFGSPAGGYMTLICFKNGSLAREKIRDQYGLDWAQFSEHIRKVPAADFDGLMLPYYEPEIVPRVLEPGVRRKNLDPSDAAANCRAVVEAQMMSMRIHSEWMGTRPKRIYATGGAAVDTALLQVMADVLQCPVYRCEVGNSAALGSALRAYQAYEAVDGDAQWEDILPGFISVMEDSRVEPDPALAEVYEQRCQRYLAFESEA